MSYTSCNWILQTGRKAEKHENLLRHLLLQSPIYDNQAAERIKLETEAKLYIQHAILDRRLELDFIVILEKTDEN
ncbi:MAG: hypothetical protein GY862_09645 [Gammaproteobacteria bacterium]|nr:hypothetical protein [Gammaproteobacteria bacterium]